MIRNLISRRSPAAVASATAGSCTAPTPTRLKTSQTCYHRNQQYSIVGLTNAAGTLVERYTYSAYGTLGIYAANGTVRSSSTYANRYTYTGREWDADLRLYHFRARWYDPATGGFVTRDPLGYVDGMSLYRGYFGVRGIDPGGTQSRTPSIISKTVSDEDDTHDVVPTPKPVPRGVDTVMDMWGNSAWGYQHVVIEDSWVLLKLQERIEDHFHDKQFETPSCTDEDNCRSFTSGYRSRHIVLQHIFESQINFGRPDQAMNGIFCEWLDHQSRVWMVGNATVKCIGETSISLNCKTCDYHASTCLTCQLIDTFDFRPDWETRSNTYNMLAKHYTFVFIYGQGFSDPTLSAPEN